MRVIVSTSGKFHHFDLAKQLFQQGHLEKLFTAYPTQYVDGLLNNYVSSFPYLLYIEKLIRKIGLNRLAERISPIFNDVFDRFVERNLVDSDILICNNGSGLYTFDRARELGAKIVCDCGQPHIRVVYDLIDSVYEDFGKKLWYSKRLFEKKIMEYEEADLITVPSHYSAQTFIDNKIDRSKLAIIPYGVDLSLFKPYPKEDEIFRVIYVGRIEILKGLLFLLDAIGNIKLPDFELTLVGPVSNEIKMRLPRYCGNIKIIGAVPKNKLSWYYSQASIFVFPSLLDGLALVIAEAMACGLPIVATDISGAGELISNGLEGYIIPSQNSEIIRQRVMELYRNNQLRTEMSIAALNRVQNLGGWDSYGTMIIKTFSDLLL